MFQDGVATCHWKCYAALLENVRYTLRDVIRPTRLPKRKGNPFLVGSDGGPSRSVFSSVKKSPMISKKAACCSRRAPGIRCDFSEQVRTTRFRDRLLGSVDEEEEATDSKVAEDPRSRDRSMLHVWARCLVRCGCPRISLEESVIVDEIIL